MTTKNVVCSKCGKEIKLPKATKDYLRTLKKVKSTRAIHCPFCGNKN